MALFSMEFANTLIATVMFHARDLESEFNLKQTKETKLTSLIPSFSPSSPSC